MALTLPYPNMNFVPLDILTASEQNKLVANIQFIANQFPIGGSNISYAQNYRSAEYPTNDVSLDTTRIVQTIELTTGRWQVNWGFRAAYTGTTNTYIDVGLKEGSSTGSTTIIMTSSPALRDADGAVRTIIAYSNLITVSGSTRTVSSFCAGARNATGATGTIKKETCYLWAVRVQ